MVEIILWPDDILCDSLWRIFSYSVALSLVRFLPLSFEAQKTQGSRDFREKHTTFLYKRGEKSILEIIGILRSSEVRSIEAPPAFLLETKYDLSFYTHEPFIAFTTQYIG